MASARERRGIFKVLQIDDDDDNIVITRLSLALHRPVEFRAAQSVDEAFRLLGREGWTPDLILLDIRLGAGSTLPFLQGLRKWHPMTPVVILSAASIAEWSAYQALGARGFIAKPFDPLTLDERIMQLLEKSP